MNRAPSANSKSSSSEINRDPRSGKFRVCFTHPKVVDMGAASVLETQHGNHTTFLNNQSSRYLVQLLFV